ncbi:hypothetical protein OAM92_00395 [Acidimicrobiales bacterium]|nr:hypothetical protein [Acidimicrobiales bacterium]
MSDNKDLRLLTPSKITAWLDCPHYLTLKHQVDGGGRQRPPFSVGSLAKILMDKGLEHEAAVEAGSCVPKLLDA